MEIMPQNNRTFLLNSSPKRETEDCLYLGIEKLLLPEDESAVPTEPEPRHEWVVSFYGDNLWYM